MAEAPAQGASRRLALQRGAALALGFPALIGLPRRALAQGQAVDTITDGLVHPWAVAGLPDGRFLVTERPGRLRIVDERGRRSAPLAGLPRVAAVGQGGLLDVVLHPQFADNRWVYWSYGEPADDAAGRGEANGTAVARGRLEGTRGAERLTDVQVVFRQTPKVDSRAHFGSRLAFAPDGRLFIGLGDRFSRKDDAQTLDNTLGKIVRIEADGRIPTDNPLVGRDGARPEIWSWGHRNVQGLALHPRTGALWATEHGPQGGDELNLVQRGRNHGWPVITWGRNYGTGTVIGDGTERDDVAAPLRVWKPLSIAPSGLAFVTGTRHAGWQGSLLLGALRGQALVRLVLDGDKVVDEQRLLTPLGERIRDVRELADGRIVVLTDNADGRLLRLKA